MRVLAGDIGGTKTLLAIVEVDERTLKIEVEQRYDSHAFAGLAPMIQDFLAKTSARPERAGFGIAGPVIANKVETTNLPWKIDGDELSRNLGLGPTRLVNDFVAVAYGSVRLPESDFVAVNPVPRVPDAPVAILGAGTGLGEAFVVPVNGQYVVVASEGGHVDYAPRNELEMGLLRFLLRAHARVSVERVVSGLGIRNIYAYLKEAGVAPESDAMRDALARGEDLGALVGTHALAGTDPLCVATADLFVRAYGAEAGNLALKAIARGGVYVAGGIAPKILPLLTDGRFKQAFMDKGRMSPLVASTPLYVVTQPKVGLLGAAVAALY